jgi:hypothetical protein
MSTTRFFSCWFFILFGFGLMGEIGRSPGWALSGFRLQMENARAVGDACAKLSLAKPTLSSVTVIPFSLLND